MAVKTGAVSGEQQQSIARVEILVDANLAQDDWQANIYFEDALYAADGTLVPNTQVFGTRVVRRTWGEVKADPDMATLHDMITSKAYAWRDEDIAFEEANPDLPPRR